MIFDWAAAVKSIADFLKTALEKFVKDTDEKRKDDRYRAEKNFKAFMEDVKREEKDRTSDLSDL